MKEVNLDIINRDKTGKSKFTEVLFDLNDGYITIICYDYSKEHGSQDHLEVSIDTKEFNKFINKSHN